MARSIAEILRENTITSVQGREFKLSVLFLAAAAQKESIIKTADFSSDIRGLIHVTGGIQDHQLKEIILTMVKPGMIMADEISQKVFSELIGNSFDDLKDAFNELYFDKARRDPRMSFTEDNLCQFVVDHLKIKSGMRIMDMASGRGNFLKHVYEIYPDVQLYGVEKNIINVLLSQMMFYLNGIDANIQEGDGLDVRRGESYDIVFADYPWSLRYKGREEKFSKVPFDYRGQSADAYFIAAAAERLSENGQAVIIAPTGIMWREQEKSLREGLIKAGLLEAVIAMPAGTRAFTNTGYDIMILSHGHSSASFIDATECFKRPHGKKEIDHEAIDQILSSDAVIKKSYKEIEDQSYSFDPYRYITGRKPVNLVNPQRIGDLADVIRGFQASAKRSETVPAKDAQYLIVNVGDIEDGRIIAEQLNGIRSEKSNLEKFVLKKGDVIITSRGTQFKAAYFAGVPNAKVIASGNLTVIRVKSNQVRPKYLFIFLNSSTGQEIINETRTGSVVISLSKNAIEDMEVSVPDLNTQEVIEVRYDRLYERRKQLTEELKTIDLRIGSLIEGQSHK